VSALQVIGAVILGAPLRQCQTCVRHDQLTAAEIYLRLLQPFTNTREGQKCSSDTALGTTAEVMTA
jgi:hypothetical protein